MSPYIGIALILHSETSPVQFFPTQSVSSPRKEIFDIQSCGEEAFGRTC